MLAPIDPPIEAVTFDYWNTLIREDGGVLTRRRVAAWMRILDDAGLPADADALLGASRDSWKAYSANWQANTQYGSVDSLTDILGAVGLDPPHDVRDAMLEAYSTAARGADVPATDGIDACLNALRARGVAIGIVCDVGMTPSPALLEILDERGLLGSFDHWSFSDEVGWYKPAPAIFEHALKGLGGVDPRRAAHVGDRLRTDVAGALGMGMIAVRYTGVFDDRANGFAEAHLVLSSHAELPAALGLGIIAVPERPSRRGPSARRRQS